MRPFYVQRMEKEKEAQLCILQTKDNNFYFTILLPFKLVLYLQLGPKIFKLITK